MLKCHPYRAIMWCIMVHPHSMEDIHTAGQTCFCQQIATSTNMHKGEDCSFYCPRFDCQNLGKHPRGITRDFFVVQLRCPSAFCGLKHSQCLSWNLDGTQQQVDGDEQLARKDNNPDEWRLAMANMLERACKAMLPRTCFHQQLRDKKKWCFFRCMLLLLAWSHFPVDGLKPFSRRIVETCWHCTVQDAD